MGRLLFLLIFFVAFAIFAGVKIIGSGVKTAYDAVFNPQSDTAKMFLSEVGMMVSAFLNSGSSDLGQRREDLRKLLDSVGTAGRRYGFDLPSGTVKDLVAKAFAVAGVGPDYKVRTMLDMI